MNFGSVVNLKLCSFSLFNGCVRIHPSNPRAGWTHSRISRFARGERRGKFGLVSESLAPVDPAALRPLVHQRIDNLRDEELVAVNRLLLEFEARLLFEKSGDEAAGDWRAGRLTGEAVDAAIREHRRKHPYR